MLQEPRAVPHAESLQSEYGSFDCEFYFTGKGLITCKIEKTIKL
jgi:hypothetical protein